LTRTDRVKAGIIDATHLYIRPGTLMIRARADSDGTFAVGMSVGAWKLNVGSRKWPRRRN
jgi:hypothetical protein